jgi:hypothetical protein
MQFHYHPIRSYEGVETWIHLFVIFAQGGGEELHVLHVCFTDGKVDRCGLYYRGVQIFQKSSSKV